MTGDLIERLRNPFVYENGELDDDLACESMIEAAAEIVSLRTALATEREGHEAARQNFHTMQLAADALRKRADNADAEISMLQRVMQNYPEDLAHVEGQRNAAEASLAEARRCLEVAQASMDGAPCGHYHRIAMSEIRRFLAQESNDGR